jgi:hypothetical protein
MLISFERIVKIIRPKDEVVPETTLLQLSGFLFKFW